MKVAFPVEVRFEHVIKDANGKPGKTHLTVNGAPLCEMWSRSAFQSHKSGVRRVTVEEFLQNPCGLRPDGTVGKGCLELLQRT